MYGLTHNTMNSLITTEVSVHRTTQTHVYLFFFPMHSHWIASDAPVCANTATESRRQWSAVRRHLLAQIQSHTPLFSPFLTLVLRSPLICKPNWILFPPLLMPGTIYHKNVSLQNGYKSSFFNSPAICKLNASWRLSLPNLAIDSWIISIALKMLLTNITLATAVCMQFFQASFCSF